MGTKLSRSLKTPWLNREMLGLGNGGEEVTPSLTELFFTKKDAQVGILRFQPPPFLTLRIIMKEDSESWV